MEISEYNFMGDVSTFLSIDLGLSSGRTTLGRLHNGELTTEELTQFKYKKVVYNGCYYWDLLYIYQQILEALELCAQRGEQLASLGIDSWAADFVCVDKNGKMLGMPHYYRDPQNVVAMEDYFKNVMSHEEYFAKTGLQAIDFNTLFQLHGRRMNDDAALAATDKILFIPNALAWMLTGEMVCEYTITSTSALLNAKTKDFDEEVLKTVGLTRDHFPKMVQPGETIGMLSEDVKAITGIGDVPVIAVSCHDTGCNVTAVPAMNKNFAFICSGLWSLMGMELTEPIMTEEALNNNFTNEGGLDNTTRFIKNIAGLYILEACIEAMKNTTPMTYEQSIEEAKKVEQFRSIINVNDPRFYNPQNMVTAIQEYCAETGQFVPETIGQIARCILDSMALSYKQAVTSLKKTTNQEIEVMHIVGGGALNDYLNQITADACNLKVVAGPANSTALGNIMVQAIATGEVANLMGIRYQISLLSETKEYIPRHPDLWDAAYDGFLILTGQYEGL
ncbi:MAG: rhamnulokinase [Bacteroidaceae bacterium]|nr:rhamnulokinase [Bacteroidaceae bacterium]